MALIRDFVDERAKSWVLRLIAHEGTGDSQSVEACLIVRGSSSFRHELIKSTTDLLKAISDLLEQAGRIGLECPPVALFQGLVPEYTVEDMLIEVEDLFGPDAEAAADAIWEQMSQRALGRPNASEGEYVCIRNDSSIVNSILPFPDHSRGGCEMVEESGYCVPTPSFVVSAPATLIRTD